jgi:peptidoglycan/xylan/chitin deacetylase (PgdA/CDA1 family)
MLFYQIFYTLKPFIPRRLQIAIRRQRVAYKKKKYAHIWPIDPNSGAPPTYWNSWPDGKRFAFILTHDVDTQRGHDRCRQLMDLEEELGFKSSFNFVPELYKVSAGLINEIKQRGFEVGVHGLKHDGKLYASKKIFHERARKINRYIKEWDAVGFRSPAMHNNFEWIHKLEIEYDASSFDTDPFEPQSDGVGTIFPFRAVHNENCHSYIELPYTLPQDFTLFIIMMIKNINIWKRKLDWIVTKGGMALINTHSDYMSFDGEEPAKETYPVEYYIDFLDYVKTAYAGQYYHALPSEIARYCMEIFV